MAKKPASETRQAGARGPDDPPPPPESPPAETRKLGLMGVVKGTPAWVKGLLGFIALAGAALGVIFSYLPPKLEVSLRECRPELVKLEVTNVGGQTATLGDVEFEMVSTARFGDRNRHAMDERALDNPMQPSNRAIDRNKAQSYEWLNVFQREEANDGETCHIYATVPLMNDPARRFSADCTCSAH